MLRKLVALFLSVLFLTACSKKEELKEPEFPAPAGWIGPTSGPDTSKIRPDYSPDEEESANDLAN